MQQILEMEFSSTFMLKSSTTKLSPSLSNFSNRLLSMLSIFWTNLDKEFIEKGSDRRRLILLWLSWGTHSKLFFPTASAIDFTYPLLNSTKSLAKIVLAPSTLGTYTWILPKILVLNHFPYLSHSIITYFMSCLASAVISPESESRW